MKKINIIKRNEEYNRIIKNCKSYKYKDIVVYIEWVDNSIYHFGFSVGKKVGNAVTRNRIKRQLKSILDKLSFKNNFNCIIIVRKSILEKTFQEIQDEMIELVKKLDIMKERNDEEKNN